MSNYLDNLNNIAEAIQYVEQSSIPMTVQEMPNRIKALGGNTNPVILQFDSTADPSSTDDYARDGLAINTGAGYQYGVMFLSVASGTRTSTKDFLSAVLANPQKISVENLPEYSYQEVYTKNPFTSYDIVSIDLLDNISLQPRIKPSLWYSTYKKAVPNSFAIWFDTYNPDDGSTYQRRTYLCAIVTISGGDSSDSSN